MICALYYCVIEVLLKINRFSGHNDLNVSKIMATCIPHGVSSSVQLKSYTHFAGATTERPVEKEPGMGDNQVKYEII